MKFYTVDGDAIGFWDKLEDLAKIYGVKGQESISNFRRRYEAKVRTNYRLRTLVNPWGEIKRLRAFIDNMRREESQAAKNALDLYAENEVLRKYKDLADGTMYRFVPLEEYERVKKELHTKREECSRVGAALNAQQIEWNEYMKSVDIGRG